MTWGVTAVAGATLVSGYMGGEVAESAAETSAGASRYAGDLTQQQYEQTRRDLAPYRDVAVGSQLPQNITEQNANRMLALSERGVSAEMLAKSYRMPVEDIMNALGWASEPVHGGALGELADYGRSKVLEGDYIPASEIPEYQRSTVGDLPQIQSDVPQFDVDGNIVGFDVQGDIPEFDPNQFDIYKDPSYEFRRDEMMRGVDRAAAGMGKVTSGNRLEEIMARSGEMASQEYGAARGRFLEDYGIQRGVEQEQYGRDVYGYGQQRQAETEQYGRDVGEYGIRSDIENRLYGRGVDEYGRAYGRDVDQYGRDLTAYNAATAREAGTYGRGVDEYGRALSEEQNYLNRLANLSQVGQTATAQTAQYGAQAAGQQSQAIQAAGQAQAAGQIGQAAAWQQGIGDMTSLYSMNQMRQPPTYSTEYSPVTSQYYGYQ